MLDEHDLVTGSDTALILVPHWCFCWSCTSVPLWRFLSAFEGLNLKYQISLSSYFHMESVSGPKLTHAGFRKQNIFPNNFIAFANRVFLLININITDTFSLIISRVTKCVLLYLKWGNVLTEVDAVFVFNIFS